MRTTAATAHVLLRYNNDNTTQYAQVRRRAEPCRNDRRIVILLLLLYDYYRVAIAKTTKTPEITARAKCHSLSVSYNNNIAAAAALCSIPTRCRLSKRPRQVRRYAGAPARSTASADRSDSMGSDRFFCRSIIIILLSFIINIIIIITALFIPLRSCVIVERFTHTLLSLLLVTHARRPLCPYTQYYMCSPVKCPIQRVPIYLSAYTVGGV